MTSTSRHTPLHDSPYPLAFVTVPGHVDGSTGTSVTYRCEVMGLGGFQKEGLVENTTTGRTWRLACDEGAYLRGADMAPAPLSHWIAGIHGDITARIASAAAERGIAIEELSVLLTQGFGASGSFARGEATALVFDFVLQVTIVCDVSDDIRTDVVTAGLRASPAYAAIRTPNEGRFALYTNGKATPVTDVSPLSGQPELDPFRRYAAKPEPATEVVLGDDIMARRAMGDGWAIQLTDDQQDTVQWRTQASGSYDWDTGLVASEVGFVREEGGASTWTLVSDATNACAPDPLAYFAMGTAFCFHTQLARYVHVRRLAVQSPRLTQLSRFAAQDGNAAAEPFDTHVFIRGSAESAQAASLLSAAGNTCYAHRALAVTVMTRVAVLG